MKKKKLTDKEKILNGEWVECYICSQIFYRKRETGLYCSTCERGFCIGEHGTFLHGNVGCCLGCNSSILKKE